MRPKDARIFGNSDFWEHYTRERWQNIDCKILHPRLSETLVGFLLLYTKRNMSNASNERYIDLALKNRGSKNRYEIFQRCSKNVIYEFSEYSMTYDENGVVCIFMQSKSRI